MNFTEAELRQMSERIASRHYAIQRVKWAAQRNDKGDSDHPENIRRRIAEMETLLREAGA